MGLLKTLKRAALSDAGFVALLVLATITRGYYGYYNAELPPVTGYPMHVSVMIATGRGFVEPVGIDSVSLAMPDAPALGRFLRHEAPELRPKDVPADLPTVAPTYLWVYYHIYLYYTVGILWRIFGISWNVFVAFRIALLCIAETAVYGLFRFALRRSWSLIAALFLFPCFLTYCGDVRDFSKADFILTAMFTMGCLLKYPVPRSGFFGLAALLGLLVGVGFGFRADVIVCLPASVIVLACCVRPDRPERGARRNLRAGLERLAAVGLLAGIFLVVGWPILKAYNTDRLSVHDFGKGLATVFDTASGVGAASYETMCTNHDEFVECAVDGYSARMRPSHEPSSVADTNLRREEFIGRILRTFPGDMITRAYVSTLWVLRGGMLDGPQGGDIDFWKGFMAAWTAAALFLVARRDPRLACTLFILLMYFCGYLSFQADRRHGFHLGFIPVLAVGFVLDRTIGAFRRMAAAPGAVWTAFCGNWRHSLVRMVVFAGTALLVLLVPLYVARALQHKAVRQLLPQYARADLEPVPVRPQPLQDWVLFERETQAPFHSGTMGRPRQPCNCEYWVAEFSGSTAPRAVYLRYLNQRGARDYSQGVWVTLVAGGDAGPVRYFFPVYETTDFNSGAWSLFDGIAVSKEQVQDFKGLYRVRNDWDFPLFLNLAYPSDLSAFLDHQVVFGRTRLLRGGDLGEEGRWFPADPELLVPGINDVAHLSEPDKVAERFRTALKTDGNNPVLLLGLAVALDAKGEAPAALDVYGQALAANPQFYVTCHYIDAFFSRRNDIEGRVSYWRTVSQAFPGHWLTCFHLAAALEEKKDFEEALTAYRRAIALNPADAQIWSDIGRLLSTQVDLSGAVEAVQRAHELDPASPYLLMDLGDLKMRQQDFGSACAVFCAAIALDPEQQRAHQQLLEAQIQLRDFTAAWKQVAECRKRNIPVAFPTMARLKELSGRSE